MNKIKENKTILAIIAFVIISLVATALIRAASGDNVSVNLDGQEDSEAFNDGFIAFDDQESSEEDEEQPDEDSDQEDNDEPLLLYDDIITLEAVNGYDASGSATRQYDETTYTHTVTAAIQDPAEGKFYEGWIVGPSIISTGAMEKEGDNWTITYTSADNLEDHKSVVITEETSADGLDGNPETHVLEGKF